MTAKTASTPRAPALLLGIGLGGFVDGIVLHQVLQWHHLLTATGDHPATTVPGLQANTLADGFLHVATWLAVLTGTLLLVRAWRAERLAPPWAVHVGLLLAGWGLFNLVEGVVNHHLLGIHHVRDDLGAPLSWDLGFLALGALLALSGLALIRFRDGTSPTTAGARPGR
jgi:uncharacterized membrane protein